MLATEPSAPSATYTSWTVPPRPISLPRLRVKPSSARWATRSPPLVCSGGVPITTTRGQRSRLRSRGVKKSRSATSWSEEVRPVASKTRPLYVVPSPGSRRRSPGDAEGVEDADQRLGQPAAATHGDRAVTSGAPSAYRSSVVGLGRPSSLVSCLPIGART